MVSRNGSRGKGKVDSASSLEQGADVAPAPQPPAQHAAVQEQLGGMKLAE